jgi:molybdenum cofactor cytidylyltransferase
VTPLRELGAVILAAGQSARMGGPNKLLRVWNGKPLASHVFEQAASLDLKDIVVVTGRDAPEIAGLAGAAGLRTLHNPGYRDGMGTSLAAGVRALGGCSGVFVILADMPRVPRSAFQILAAALETEGIALPVFEGRRGHPVLFSAAYRDGLMQVTGDTGARALLAAHADAVREVEIASPGVLFDCDTEADFAAAGGRDLGRPSASATAGERPSGC